MVIVFIFFASLVLAWQASDALKFHIHQRQMDQASELASGPIGATELAASFLSESADDPVLVRPNAETGMVDVVHFGLIAKNFFGAELKHNRFSMDLVLSLRWRDPRVAALIPKRLDRVSISWSQALKLVWMPGVVIANRDIQKYEIISSSVTLFRSGEVLRVERAMARCMDKYQLHEYPFDTQNLNVELVSSKYMMNEVELVPNVTATAVSQNILWGEYYQLGWQLTAHEDRIGTLRKSRGCWRIGVRRSLVKYVDDHLVPVFIVLMISWAVFYFPFKMPFITPRLALSALALLTFTNLMVKSTNEVPGNAPFNWNDLFNQQIETLMYLTIIINITSEICYHQFDNEPLAKMINNEAKVLLPLAGVLNVGIVLSAGMYRWMTLSHATIATKIFIVVFLLAYVGYVCGILKHSKRLQPSATAAEEPKRVSFEDGPLRQPSIKSESSSGHFWRFEAPIRASRTV